MAALSLSVSTVKPLGDRVFVKVNASEEKTAGGLYLPDTAKEKPQVGEVVALLARASVMTTETVKNWKLKSAIRCCTRSTLALTSNSAPKNMYCFLKKIF